MTSIYETESEKKENKKMKKPRRKRES